MPENGDNGTTTTVTVEAEPGTTVAVGEQAGATAAAGTVAAGGDELAALRERLVADNPNAVADLIVGNSVGELLAAVDRAKAAYGAVAERVRGEAAAAVPAGGAPRLTAAEVEALPASEKIRRGLAAEQRREGR